MCYFFEGAVQKFCTCCSRISEFGVEHDLKEKVLGSVGDLCVAEGAIVAHLAEEQSEVVMDAAIAQFHPESIRERTTPIRSTSSVKKVRDHFNHPLICGAGDGNVHNCSQVTKNGSH
jgi:hypothetical protein